MAVDDAWLDRVEAVALARKRLRLAQNDVAAAMGAEAREKAERERCEAEVATCEHALASEVTALMLLADRQYPRALSLAPRTIQRQGVMTGPPPVDNAHVAPGCQRFTEQDVTAAAIAAGNSAAGSQRAAAAEWQRRAAAMPGVVPEAIIPPAAAPTAPGCDCAHLHNGACADQPARIPFPVTPVADAAPTPDADRCECGCSPEDDAAPQAAATAADAPTHHLDHEKSPE